MQLFGSKQITPQCHHGARDDNDRVCGGLKERRLAAGEDRWRATRRCRLFTLTELPRLLCCVAYYTALLGAWQFAELCKNANFISVRTRRRAPSALCPTRMLTSVSSSCSMAAIVVCQSELVVAPLLDTVLNHLCGIGISQTSPLGGDTHHFAGSFHACLSAVVSFHPDRASAKAVEPQGKSTA